MRKYAKYIGTEQEKIAQAIEDCKIKLGDSCYQYCIDTIRQAYIGRNERCKLNSATKVAKLISKIMHIKGFQLYAMIKDATKD